MLINLSNHPSSKWNKEQTAEAQKLYGEIVDMQFPQVDPQADETQVVALAEQYLERISALASGQPVTVHLMGEMNFTFSLVTRLQKKGFPCVASTTQRMVIELGGGRKDAVFQFVRFRNYL